MKKIVVVVLLFIAIVGGTYAQGFQIRVNSIYAGVGANSYFGDIGSTKSNGSASYESLNFFNKEISFLGGVSFDLIDNLDARIAFGYLTFGGSDEHSKFEEIKDKNSEFSKLLGKGNSEPKSRDYAFETEMLNFDILAEYTFFSYNLLRGKGGRTRFNRKRGLVRRYMGGHAYALLGFGYGKSKTTFKKGLKADNEGKKKNNLISTLPIGIGFRLSIAEGIFIGMETGARVCFSDRIDGFKPYFSRANDMSYFTNIYLSYNFVGKKWKHRYY